MKDGDAELALLAPATVSAYLNRLAVERPARCDLAALTALQAAHLRAVPFHNLALLAAAGRDPGLPPVAAAVEGALRGHGGTCHVLAPPFVALLRSLGFDAHLAAASVAAPGDHLIAVVHLEGRRWLCDVGNGHPYLRPFPLDPDDDPAAVEHEQAGYGWRFRIEPLPAAPNPVLTHQVLRLLPDGTWKVVYTVDPQRVPYSAFARIIVEHHTRVGFGPFLTGLRAVRMTAERLLCLRDCWLERYGGGPPGRRRVPSARAVGAVLTQHFGLGELPWQDALRTLEPQTRQWWSSGSASGSQSAAVPADALPLRILISVGLTNRPGNLWALGQELLRDGLGSQSGPPGAGILAFENSDEPACARDSLAAAAALSAAGLPTYVWEQVATREARQRLASAGMVAEDPSAVRVSIATSRMVQVGLLAAFFRGRPADGRRLPHPHDGHGPVAVWMLDDDLRLKRLERVHAGLECTPLVNLRGTLDTLYRQHPEISVLIGGNTGCPPVPGFSFLHVQTQDLVAHVKSASRQDPDAPYLPRTNPRHLPDYYYDTSDAGEAHLGLAFDWEPEAGTGPLSVRAALLAHLRAFPSLLHGQPATRLLVHEPDLPVVATTARGGNAIFFDLDALFAAPYVAAQLTDGLVTRRGDTVWALLASAVPGISLFQAPFPVHHTRCPGDGSGPTLATQTEAKSLRRFILAQLGGIVLSRLITAQRQGRVPDPRALLEQRVGRVRAAFASAALKITDFVNAEYETRTDLWWSRTHETAVRYELTRVKEMLELLKAEVLTGELVTPAELDAATESLAVTFSALGDTGERWRRLWP